MDILYKLKRMYVFELDSMKTQLIKLKQNSFYDVIDKGSP